MPNYLFEPLFRYYLKGELKKYPPFSQGGAKKGNPIMTTNTVTHGHGQDNRRPSTYVEGKIMENNMLKSIPESMEKLCKNDARTNDTNIISQ